jgi:formylglycine-generating enzyme required for sulfatase activity
MTKKIKRVYRGGGLRYGDLLCRAALRYWYVPDRRDAGLGLRPAFRLKKKR